MPAHTMTMPFFSDSNSFFTRSRSSSTLSTLSTSSNLPPPRTKIAELPKAASFSSLPDLEVSSIHHSIQESKDCSVEIPKEVISLSITTVEDGTEITKCTGLPDVAGKEERTKADRNTRRKSLVQVSRAFMSKVKGSPEKKAILEDSSESQNARFLTSAVNTVATEEELKLRSNTFSSFSRRSWMPVSRSPSPSRTIRDDSSRDEDDSTTASSVSSTSARNSSPARSRSKSAGPESRSTSPGLGLFRRSAKVKEQSNLNREAPKVPGSPSLNSATNARSSSSAQTHVLANDIPPSPKKISPDKLASLGQDSPKRKDDLVLVFRALENDYQKFSTRPNGLRASVVRTTLLPFLRSHTNHAANKEVCREDLEQRVSVLNKWWVGLLEMLDGNSNRYISGGDRPVILEAVTGIMTRPEWRLSSSDFSSWTDKQKNADLEREPFSNLLDNVTTQLRDEDGLRRIRALFIQNLLSQMSIVVEKMSLKNTPASFVNFCGKAVAYAFFFCPGVADVLVKIWAVQSDTIRRVVNEFDLVAHSGSKDKVDESTAAFPENVRSLGWSSARSLLARLRQRSTLPMEAAKIDWHGPWVTRWAGRDSDLFFVFCKYYHILLEDFLPPDASLAVKARSPGFVLVQCQLLVSLDRTLHRNSGEGANIPASFDEMLNGADASAGALPLPPSSNSVRLMAENRLIMLIRDCLTDRSDNRAARRTIAASFAKIMHAAAKRTSQFDHGACFLLCDFMEEALSIYIQFQATLEDGQDYIDWAFWFDVCRNMLQSQNSMTEIRIFSLLYGAWNIICENQERKGVLCLELLLDREVFQTYFLHWCPMVRAYYMRLLCWRLSKFDGEASKLDTKIFAALSDEIKAVWSNYLALKRSAESERRPLPSTAPCYPAPGRRLLIVRMDTQAAAANLMMGYNGANQKKSSSSASKAMLKSTSSKQTMNPSNQEVKSKKRWSLAAKPNNVNGTAIGPGHQPQSSSLTKDRLTEARSATAASRTRPALSTSHSKSNSISSEAGSLDPLSPDWQTYSFKFSLEWHANPPVHTAFQLQNQQSNGKHDKQQTPSDINWVGERRLNPPRLPARAHSWLVSQVPGTANEVMAKDSGAGGKLQSKYSGRSLAEWALLVLECNNFISRRMSEGVPTLRQVEIPALGVEGFRKLG